MQPKVRPIQRFAQAVSKCSAEATVYGQCVFADYNSVHKDKCVKEFVKLKDCYLVCFKLIKSKASPSVLHLTRPRQRGRGDDHSVI
ncbi:hypothetical protein C7999DRAFT_13461 [Corynascus novoguineensis]|uniref:Uncharacterized protein n=1 Tax=Corynascus novoguineensis TaxID=1126955 RepID=A0AAN7CX92_9PEZI|nr:hypothetical protein C7999DRAFT_13461 [Corynascus novoguineensis]